LDVEFHLDNLLKKDGGVVNRRLVVDLDAAVKVS
jgi:hypothetical protein